MQFTLTADRDDLLATLATVERYVGRHGSNQSINLIRLRHSQERGETFAEATDLAMSLRTHLWGTFDADEVDVLVHPRLRRAVAALSGEVRVTTTPGTELEVTGKGKARYTVPIGANTGWPNINYGDVDWDDVVPVDAKEAFEAMSVASRFASRQESNPGMMGVNLRQDGDELVVSATDAHRLFQRRLQLPDKGFPFGEQSVTLPLRMVEELAKLFPDGEVKLAADDNCFFATAPQGGVDFMARRVGGAFPEIDRLVKEEDFKEKVRISRLELTEALDRIKSLAEDKKPVEVNLGKDGEVQLRIKGETGSAEEYVYAAQGPQVDMRIGFNVDQFRTALSVFDTDEVTLDLISPLRPALLTGNTDRRVLMMPVRIA